MTDLKINRIESIDILRVLVMIIMDLDHTRVYFYFGSFLRNPTKVETTTPIVFFTRFSHTRISSYRHTSFRRRLEGFDFKWNENLSWFTNARLFSSSLYLVWIFIIVLLYPSSKKYRIY